MSKDHTIATLTNLAYGYAGWSMLSYSDDLLIPALTAIALMVGSGIHHWYLQDWSRKYDYIGMYLMVISLILIPFSLNTGAHIVITSISSMAIYWIFGSRREVMGLGVLALLVLLHIFAPIGSALLVGSIMAVALVFNMIGDKTHKEDHDWIHGLGWHLPSAAAIFLTAKFLL